MSQWFARRPGHGVALRSISILWIGTAGGAGLAFATQVVLARSLGVAQFGSFSATLATVTLVAPLAGFGVAAYWLSAFGREGWAGLRWLPGSFKFLTISSFTVLAALLTWAWTGPHDRSTALLLSILAVHILGQAVIALTNAKFQLEGRHARLAEWQFTPHLLRLICIVALAAAIGTGHFAAQHAAVAFAAVALLVLLLGAYQLRLMAQGQLTLEGHGAAPTKAPNERTDHPGPTAIALAAWPFGLSGLFYVIYFQSDIILLKYLVDESAAGIYNVAFVIMAAVYLFPAVMFQKFLLPRLHRWAHHDATKLQEVYRTGNRVMLTLGLTAMVSLWALTPVLLPLLFGDAYHDAVALIMILAVAAPFRFVASSAGALLTTRNHMGVKVRLMGAAAVFNVLLNLILIPRYSATGAAAATLLTEMALMLMFFVYVRLFFFKSIVTPKKGNKL